MTVVETTCGIEAPPENVWAFVSDLERVPEWVVFTDEMLEIRHDPETGTVGEGSFYRERGGPGPIDDESTWRITAFDPPREQIHEGELGPMRITLTMAVEPTETGSRLTHRVDLRVLEKVRPLGWLLEKLVVQHVMQRGLNKTQENAQRILEAEAAAQTGAEGDGQAAAYEA